MPGDKLEVSGLSYWEDDNEEHIYTTPSSMLDNLFSTLAGGEIGNYVPENSSYLESMGQAQISLWNNVETYQDIIDGVTDPAAPRAYINYVVFDEYMNMVPEKSGAIQVNATPGSWQTMGGSQTIDPGASGYILVYLSNAQHLNVWFDNFNISFYKGELLQEEHYYPYGLNVNEGQDVNAPPNKFLFQGNERNRDFGLNLNDFNFRQYDAQIGRFNSTDLLADGGGQEMFSPYHFCANDPANYIDPLGLGSGSANENKGTYSTPGVPKNNDGINLMDSYTTWLVWFVTRYQDDSRLNVDNNLYMGSNGLDYNNNVSTRSVPSVSPSNSSADFSWMSSRSQSGYYGQDGGSPNASSPGGTPGGGVSSASVAAIALPAFWEALTTITTEIAAPVITTTIASTVGAIGMTAIGVFLPTNAGAGSDGKWLKTLSDPFPKPWIYTIPDKTNVIYRSPLPIFNPNEDPMPPNGPNGPTMFKYLVGAAGVYQLYNQLIKTPVSKYNEPVPIQDNVRIKKPILLRNTYYRPK